MKKSCSIAYGIFLFASSTLYAQNIDQSLGVDQRVGYQSLSVFGPWDDRNYLLSQEDLDVLSADEAMLKDPTPVFFRVQLRKELPNLPKTGPGIGFVF